MGIVGMVKNTVPAFELSNLPSVPIPTGSCYLSCPSIHALHSMAVGCEVGYREGGIVLEHVSTVSC